MRTLIAVLALLSIPGVLAAAQPPVRTSGASELREEENLADLLVDPGARDQERLRTLSADPIFRRLILALPDTREHRVVKQAAQFLIGFYQSPADQPAGFSQVNETILVRMPQAYYLSEPFRKDLEKALQRSYEEVRKGWRLIGTSQPDGPIYVWLLSDTEAMKSDYGTSENTRAFAMPCRFLVVPYHAIPQQLLDRELMKRWLAGEDVPSGAAIARFLREDFQRTCTHEMTHVFLFSAVGRRGLSGIDKWFSEALAIWLSGEGDKNLTEEYRGYRRAFEILRLKYGNRAFLSFARRSIESADVSGTLRSHFSIVSYERLEEIAARYSRETGYVKYILVILFPLVFLYGRHVRLRHTGYVPSTLILISVLSFCYWYFGRFNLAAESPAMSEFIGTAAFALIGVAPAAILLRLSLARRVDRRLHEARTEITAALGTEARYYSAAEIQDAQRKLSRAVSCRRAHSLREAMNLAARATLGARQAVVNIDANKKIMKEQVEMLRNRAVEGLADLEDLVTSLPEGAFVGDLQDILESFSAAAGEGETWRALQQMNEILRRIDSLRILAERFPDLPDEDPNPP